MPCRAVPCRRRQLMADLNKVEIAVAGLRKIYLPREWEPRCSTCGVRHAPLEGGTCKFWVQFALNAGERALRLAAGGDVEAPQQQPTPSPGTLAAVAAATPLSPLKQPPLAAATFVVVSPPVAKVATEPIATEPIATEPVAKGPIATEPVATRTPPAAPATSPPPASPPEPDADAATAAAAAAPPARTGVAENKPQETEEEQEVAHEVA